MNFIISCACVISLLLINPVYNAPKHRNRDHPSTTFDQTQTGDYNVQVHLKDFHIFAILGDESWGGFGDYDYNYDYSDLTVKPITSTQPPSSSAAPITPNTENSHSSSSISPSEVSSTTKLSNSATENPLSNSEPVLSSTTPKQTTKSEPVTNVSLIPVKIIGDIENDHPLPLGEILHYRKCSDGYSRDAQGRCRKILRKSSQVPFGISRLASSIVSKIRQIGSPTS